MLPFHVSVERAPVATRDAIGDRHVGHVEARAEDDRVDLALAAVLGHDRARPHLGEAACYDLDVRLRQRGIPLVGRQDALAADAVVRRELPAQLWVLDLLAHVHHRDALEQLPDGAMAELEHEGLARPVDPGPHRELGRREEPVDRSLPALHRPVAMRDHPRRRALEDVQLRPPSAGSRGRTGSRRRPCRSRPRARPVRSCSWSHSAEWNAVALEAVHARDVGTEGSLSGPWAAISTSAVIASFDVSIRQSCSSSSHSAASSSVSKRTCGSTPWRFGGVLQVVEDLSTAARRCSTSSGSARTRTSRGARARRSDSPDRCCRARCRRCRRRARAARSRARPPVSA